MQLAQQSTTRAGLSRRTSAYIKAQAVVRLAAIILSQNPSTTRRRHARVSETLPRDTRPGDQKLWISCKMFMIYFAYSLMMSDFGNYDVDLTLMGGRTIGGCFSSQSSPVPTVAPSVLKSDVAKIAVLGASGYTGAEVVRLCALHPNINVTVLTGDKQAGKNFSDVFPHLVAATNVPKLVKIDDVNFADVDAVFCCLPHATTQEVIKKLPSNLKVVDLSADFRLRDPAVYAQWYGHEHAAVELQKEAVYGLTEVYRDQVKTARLLANPGCYPTCSQLPLYPLLKAKLILPEDILIDAKSGVSGAGRSAKESNLYCEIAEGINAYAVGSHRHMPEIEQGLSEAAGTPVTVSFTPHLINMSRGMQCTSYVKLAPGVTADDLRAHLTATYEGEPFVRVLGKGVVPHTRHVRGSNYALINVFPDRLPGRAVIISVIDNLVKGASGQGLQNLNLMMGWDETTALLQLAMFP